MIHQNHIETRNRKIGRRLVPPLELHPFAISNARLHWYGNMQKTSEPKKPEDRISAPAVVVLPSSASQPVSASVGLVGVRRSGAAALP